MPVSRGRRAKPGAKAKAARQRKGREVREVAYTVRHYAAVASLDDDDAVNQARDSVYSRTMQAVHDVRHSKVEFVLIPAADEARWRAALADADGSTEEARANRDGLTAYMESDPGCALVIAQCFVYSTQQRSKAHLS